MPSRPIALVAAAAAALTLLWCALFPYRLTDGDSCLYAAMAHEMAQDGGRAWLAPTWAFRGARACFHENPPGALWAAATLECLGLPDGQAPLVANALALLALGAAAWWLAGGRDGPGPLALGILLLHVPVAHYAVRFGIELPFAACFTASVAAARSDRPLAPIWTGVAAAGALLTRGVFALALPPLLLADAWLAGSRRRLRRLAQGLLLALLLTLAFDWGHSRAAGHSFWSGYLHKQVLPSLEEGGTVHPNRGPTTLYYASRLALYTVPWLPLAAVLLLRDRRRRDACTPLVWIVLLTAGAIAARRQGSRYLFAVYPASAWLAALALRGWWDRCGARGRTALACCALALAPAVTLGKSLVTPRDAHWRAASALRSARPQLRAATTAAEPAIYGPFAPHDDRMKQFLRHHAGIWAFDAPAGQAPPGALLWLPPDLPAPGGAVFRCELFQLVRSG